MSFYMTAVIASAVLAVAAPLFAQDPTPSTQPVTPATKPAAVGQSDIPVKQVVLFSSGVGYFEHYGTVRGDAATELQFKTAQINDILKSLVLQDLDGGQVSTVTYSSEDPIAKTLKTFQIDITNNPSMADLLNQLRGAAVKVTVLNDTVEGTILGVEKRLVPGGANAAAIESWFVNVVAATGIKSIELSKVTGVELKDPKLQEELSRALAALAGARNQDKKPVAINFRGNGDRRVKLGYVVETPIWKTSYRLILADEKASLQGWAIVENQTDNDWKDVQLSLVSGRPISFVQNLYSSLYITRPVVEPELFASLRPQRYEDGIMLKQGAASDRERAGNQQRSSLRERAQAAPAPAASADMAFSAGSATAKDARPDDRPMDPTASVAAGASASQLGELFQYTIGNVSLQRQQSAMIPIVTDAVTAERVSIYNASVMPRNPLNGALVTNSTDKHLLQGPITVFDQNAYAGDAQINNVPPGQQRLLSYGIDLQTVVDSTSGNNTDNVTSGKIVKGILELSRKSVVKQEYKVESKGNKDRTLVVEHPRMQGWDLVDTDKPFESLPNLLRFRVPLKAGETKTFVVTQQRVYAQQIELLPFDTDQLLYYSRTGELSADVRNALAEAAAKKMALVDLERQIGDVDRQVNAITQEQNRIRDNMKSVDQASQYYNRLLTKLNEQEDQLDKLKAKGEDLREKLDAARKELEKYLAGLTIG